MAIPRQALAHLQVQVLRRVLAPRRVLAHPLPILATPATLRLVLVEPQGADMIANCAAPDCSNLPAVRVKTLPLCEPHARLVMADATARGLTIARLVTQDVQAALVSQSAPSAELARAVA